MKPLEDKLNQDWKKYLACDFEKCKEKGDYFRCYMIDYKKCSLYKNKEGTNCTQK